jgi:hypothetical protein
MQIKTIFRYHYVPIGMAIIQKKIQMAINPKDNTKYWQE